MPEPEKLPDNKRQWKKNIRKGLTRTVWKRYWYFKKKANVISENGIKIPKCMSTKKFWSELISLAVDLAHSQLAGYSSWTTCLREGRITWIYLFFNFKATFDSIRSSSLYALAEFGNLTRLIPLCKQTLDNIKSWFQTSSENSGMALYHVTSSTYYWRE